MLLLPVFLVSDRLAAKQIVLLPLLPVDDYSALLDGLQKERNPWFAEVASFTINSDNGDIEREAKSVVEASNK